MSHLGIYQRLVKSNKSAHFCFRRDKSNDTKKRSLLEHMSGPFPPYCKDWLLKQIRRQPELGFGRHTNFSFQCPSQPVDMLCIVNFFVTCNLTNTLQTLTTWCRLHFDPVQCCNNKCILSGVDLLRAHSAPPQEAPLLECIFRVEMWCLHSPIFT